MTGGGRVEGMLAGPHSSQLPHYDLYEGPHIHQRSSDMPSITSALSQPVPSISRRRLQSSVPDLSYLTVTSSTSNLAQGLSQSVLEMSRFRGDHTSGLRLHHDIPPRSIGRSSYQQTHLHRMSSDPHLNNEGVHHPGLARTILGRLKEEPEISPAAAARWRERGGVVGGVSAGSQSRRKRYQNMRRTPSPQPHATTPPPASTQSRHHHQQMSSETNTQPVSGSSSGNSGELTPTNTQLSLPPSNSDTAGNLATGSLGLAAGKSNSNTSLSINLI